MPFKVQVGNVWWLAFATDPLRSTGAYISWSHVQLSISGDVCISLYYCVRTIGVGTQASSYLMMMRLLLYAALSPDPRTCRRGMVNF